MEEDLGSVCYMPESGDWRGVREGLDKDLALRERAWERRSHQALFFWKKAWGSMREELQERRWRRWRR